VTPAEAQHEAAARLLTVLAGAAGTGLAARAALAAVSPSSYATASPKKPTKVVIPLAGPAAEPSPALPTALTPKLAGAGAIVAGPVDLSANSWFSRNLPGIAGLWNRNLFDQTPMSGAKATAPEEVPWLPAGAVLGGGLGLAGGWAVGDRLVKAYQRHRARRELDASRQNYNDEILAAYTRPKAADDGLAALGRGEVPADPDLAAAHQALEAAWEATKDAADGFENSLLYRALFPGTNFGPFGSAVNLGTILAAAGLSGYGAYRYARDTDTERLKRESALAAEREDLQERPPVIVGQIASPPPPKPAAPPVGLGRRLGLTPAGV
jgi:hypothetical protein